jgi:hypothetical protein
MNNILTGVLVSSMRCAQLGCPICERRMKVSTNKTTFCDPDDFDGEEIKAMEEEGDEDDDEERRLEEAEEQGKYPFWENDPEPREHFDDDFDEADDEDWDDDSDLEDE